MATVQVALWVVVLLVALAIAFDFMNGFHDAANSIATVVSTGVLKPQQAVVFAAAFNFIAVFVFHLSVAATIGKGIVMPGIVDAHVVFGALIGAIAWNVITWWYGIPSSSSHALIGGIVGAVIAKTGVGGLIAAGVLKTVAFIFVSPLLGFLLGSLLMVVVAWLMRGVTPLLPESAAPSACAATFSRRARAGSGPADVMVCDPHDDRCGLGLMVVSGYKAAPPDPFCPSNPPSRCNLH